MRINRLHRGMAEYNIYMSNKFKHYLNDMSRAHRLVAKETFRGFLDVISGLIRQSELDKMGNPFARLGTGMRGVSPRFYKKRSIASYRESSDVLHRRYTDGSGKSRLKSQITRRGNIELRPINIQSGLLKKLSNLDGPEGFDQTYKIYSSAPWNKWILSLGGTDLMVPRGVLGKNGWLRRWHRRVKFALITAHRNRLHS